MKYIGKLSVFILLSVWLCGCSHKTQSYLTATQESGLFPETETGAGTETSAGTKTAAGTETSAGTKTAAGARTEDADSGFSGETLLVYVCGEVENPGVYELPAGSRICDAVDAAGGMTAAAGREYWNLAQPLTDGQMICFPTEEEAKERQESAGAPVSDASGIQPDGRVNINTASLEQLMTIPGVGQTRGEAILAYRKEHGSFQSAQDITKVSGIGNALYEKMKNYIAI